eukprot:3186624-Rhodomonas_salina.1
MHRTRGCRHVVAKAVVVHCAFLAEAAWCTIVACIAEAVCKGPECTATVPGSVLCRGSVLFHCTTCCQCLGG